MAVPLVFFTVLIVSAGNINFDGEMKSKIFVSEKISGIFVPVVGETAKAFVKQEESSQDDGMMGYYVKSIAEISQQLVANPNGAPKEYVNGIKKYAGILNKTYVFLDKCQETNGEGVEWEVIDVTFDKMQASIEELRHLVKTIMSSPNYNAWHGHEFSKALEGISYEWEYWEYNLFQIGT